MGKVGFGSIFPCFLAIFPISLIIRSLGRFSLATVAFGVFPLFLPLAITACGGSEGYFILAIITFGAFEFLVPKYYYHLGKMDKGSLGSLI